MTAAEPGDDARPAAAAAATAAAAHPPDADVGTSRGRGWGGGSGPAVARTFHRALALIFLIAWISLGSQILLLIGSRGLLPWAELVDVARAEGALSVLGFPSVFVWFPSDRALIVGIVVGVGLAVAALAGWRPRLCALLQTALYLSFVTACRGFLTFQWDNLLLECGLLATFLPTGRRAPLAHFLFRALLFKLYLESGIAKWQSPIGDWTDGSAMTFYYETAPLPTAIAWTAHHLPRWWHLFESRATLFIELVIPFAAFGPRRARLAAAFFFTLFQTINMATANYGFFCPLSAALGLFLLDDIDVERATRGIAKRTTRLRRAIRARVARVARVARTPQLSQPQTPPLTPEATPRPTERNATRAARARRVLSTGFAALGVTTWIAVSTTEAWFNFGDPGPGGAALIPIVQLAQTLRVVNTFHLFAAVTRERVEPEIQIRTGDTWTAYPFHYKPGDPMRAPPFVAPHQPRVDFLLWFYGLSYERRQPTYVATLLARLCEDPDAVTSLFESPLPRAPAAVKIVFWDTHFTSATEKRATGAWWTRREIASTEALPCSR